MRNCLLERNSWTFYQDSSTALPFTLNQYNNLVWHGGLGYYYYSTNTAWTVQDNLFHADSLSSFAQNFASIPQPVL